MDLEDQTQGQDQDYDLGFDEPAPAAQPKKPTYPPSAQRQNSSSQSAKPQAQEVYFDDDEEAGEMVIKNPQALIKALESYKSQAKGFKKLLSEAGLSPEEVKELSQFKKQQQQALKESEEKELELKGQYAALADRKVQELQEQFGKQQTQLQKRNEALEKQVQQLSQQLEQTTTQYKSNTLKSRVKDFYLSQGGSMEADEDGENPYEIFWSRYGSRFNLQDDETIEVYDRSGQNLALDAEGKPIDPNGFLNHLKSSNVGRIFFQGIQPSGNATPQSSKSATVKAGSGQEVREFSGVVDLAEMGLSLDDVISGKVKFQQQRR